MSHWSQLIEGLEASPMGFYASVEQAIERRKIPETERSRVDWHEGGIATAKREYLRVKRREHIIDICGAPFGKGFFVSWWLGEMRAGPWTLLLVFFGIFVVLTVFLNVFGLYWGFLLTLLAVPALLWVLARHAPATLEGWDDPVVEIPWLGVLYERWIRPASYYRTDTALMFRAAVHAAVLEVIDELTEAKGLRALPELDRKPIQREFFGR